MESSFRSRGGGKWRRRRLYRGLIFVLLAFLIIFIHFSQILSPIFASFQISRSKRMKNQCMIEEKFVFYAPHSGFSNQVSEMRNGVVIAAILNRTLIIPPVLDHHAVALGSCPKFRVSSASDLRARVWDHAIELLRNRRFVSMADIVDLSSVVSSSMVKIIDFREFVAVFCGIDLNLVCADTSELESLPREFDQCKNLLSRPDSDAGYCSYGVEDDCRTTVWTYGQEIDELLDQFQPDEELKRKKKIKFSRRRRDILKALGPGSKADEAKVLAFGSLFSSPYKGSELHIDIHEAPKDSSIHSLLRNLDHIPFTKEILDSGKKFALSSIKSPFLCAQLRLLDGQFKNHWKETFAALRQKIDLLSGHEPISIFVMTDLPEANWPGTYLEDLKRNSSHFKLFTLSEDDNLIYSDHILRTSSFSENISLSRGKEYCPPSTFPSVLLYVQEAVCSCASLGFVGTSGSTIADNIEAMRKNNICKS